MKTLLNLAVPIVLFTYNLPPLRIPFAGSRAAASGGSSTGVLEDGLGVLPDWITWLG
jgi:hypothetical protein